MSETKQLVEILITAWNAHDPNAVERCYTPDCEEVDVAAREPQRGSAAIRKLMKYYLRAFPDVQITIHDLLVEGDRAALVWMWQGTHKGRFMNIPATGRRVTVRGTTVLSVREGRIHRVMRIWDVAGLLRGIGLLPDL
jgi:steroid delta-isomerase-like uncharacterized protein